MKLKKLVKIVPEAPIKGPKDVEITGLCSNSRLVAPGDLFVVKKGRVYDGHDYISGAIASGAAAILTDIYDPFLKQIPQVIHPNVSAIEGLLAAHFYGNPSEKLHLVGVTGTNGKTTCSYLIKHMFDSSGIACGLTSTVENIIGENRYPATRTTADVTSNHKLLHEMTRSACQAAVMEVSSHALDQGRLDQVYFKTAIFTNLSQEHLDYHLSMEEYAKAKACLFRDLNVPGSCAIVNVDDPYSEVMLKECSARIIRYGFGEKADVQASQVQLSTEGTHFVVSFEGKEQAFFWKMAGEYNVYNALTAISLGLSLGRSLEDLAQVLPEFTGAPGRLESVPNSLGVNVFVDYAHTPHALENVLKCLKEVTAGKIITVFGCGGDRDKEKRPMMGAAAEAFSDRLVITSDNPRTEPPMAIIEEVATGLKGLIPQHVEEDREKAIELAIEKAVKGDVVLIAGKGHERSQTFAHHTIPFDDKEVASKICIQKSTTLQESGSVIL
jgi:UDP-N-acetylmuramoyl-L-alanyl-D-glutamate--2,6-diaminopimelate ligase